VIEIEDVDSGSFICRRAGCVEGFTSHVAHGPVLELAQLQCCPNLDGAQARMSGLAFTSSGSTTFAYIALSQQALQIARHLIRFIICANGEEFYRVDHRPT